MAHLSKEDKEGAMVAMQAMQRHVHDLWERATKGMVASRGMVAPFQCDSMIPCLMLESLIFISPMGDIWGSMADMGCSNIMVHAKK